LQKTHFVFVPGTIDMFDIIAKSRIAASAAVRRNKIDSFRQAIRRSAICSAENRVFVEAGETPRRGAALFGTDSCEVANRVRGFW
jgi:hypothetical protein